MHPRLIRHPRTNRAPKIPRERGHLNHGRRLSREVGALHRPIVDHDLIATNRHHEARPQRYALHRLTAVLPHHHCASPPRRSTPNPR